MRLSPSFRYQDRMGRRSPRMRPAMEPLLANSHEEERAGDGGGLSRPYLLFERGLDKEGRVGFQILRSHF